MTKMYKLSLISLLWCVTLSIAQAQSYEDKRCQCTCPTPDNVFNNTNTKELTFFRDIIPPNKCNCYGLIVPKLGDIIKGRERQYCQRCECKYEMRNTTLILLVVILVLWMMALLCIYMVFLLILDPMLKYSQQRRLQRSINDDEETMLPDAMDGITFHL